MCASPTLRCWALIGLCVAIAVSNPARLRAQGEEIELANKRVLSRGEIDWVFLRPSRVTLDSKGRFWVAQGPRGPLLAFDGEGSRAQSLSVVNHLVDVLSVISRSDTLIVLDRDSTGPRILRVGMDGGPIRTLRLSGSKPPLPFDRMVVTDILDYRSVVAIPAVPILMLPRLPDRAVPIWRVSSGGAILGVLGVDRVPTALQAVVWHGDTAGFAMSWYGRLFNRAAMWRVTPDRQAIMFLSERAGQNVVDVSVRSIAARTTALPPFAFAPTPVPNSLTDTLLIGTGDLIRNRFSISTAQADSIRRRFWPVPKQFPAVFDLLPCVDGGFWLQIGAPITDSIHWQVVDRTGKERLDVRLSRDSRPLMCSRLYLWVAEKDTGVATAVLARYELHQRP